MIVIRNTNPDYGMPIPFCGETLEQAITDMQDAVRACGPEFTDVVVTDNDYDVIE